MAILLFHGSSIGGLSTLQPFTADHGKPYVYFTTNDISAAFYAARAIERPYYWVPFSYDTQGRITYTEVWNNAMAEVFSGKSGYVYCCEADDKNLLRFPTHHSMRLSPEPVNVARSDKIDDLYEWFLQREHDGKLVIQRFETLSPDQRTLWHGMVLEELIDRYSGQPVSNPYTRFVQEKMPSVWERFLQKSK